MHELGHKKGHEPNHHGHHNYTRGHSPSDDSSGLRSVQTSHLNLHFPAQPRVPKLDQHCRALHTDNAIRIKAYTPFAQGVYSPRSFIPTHDSIKES